MQLSGYRFCKYGLNQFTLNGDSPDQKQHKTKVNLIQLRDKSVFSNKIQFNNNRSLDISISPGVSNALVTMHEEEKRGNNDEQGGQQK